MDVSIIILNYNTKKLTLDCIDSVKKYTKGISYEVIVVDNASTDDSWESIKNIKGIKSIKSKENGGFSKGNNLGIKEARGKYVLLLNSDVLLFENTIKEVFDVMETRPDIGALGCKLLNTDKTIQSNGGYFPTLGRLFLWGTFLDDLPSMDLLGSYHPHTSFYEKERELDWVTGAFFFVRMDVLNQVGFLSEKFFMYVEELELCYRIKQKGLKILYTPLSSVIHIGRASASSKNAILGEFRGLLLFYKLHKNMVARFILRLLLIKAALLRAVLFAIMGRLNSAKIYAQAITIN